MGCREDCRTVIDQQELAPGYFLLRLAAPELAAAAQPGQFAMLSCGEERFLRRPISLHAVDRERGEVNFLYQVRGAGTRWLSELLPGSMVGLLAPLGRGFDCRGQGRALLAGAGIGAAPLLFLAAELAAAGWRVETCLGGRGSGGILRPGEFARYGNVRVTTDDGSAGRRGGILDLLAEEAGKQDWDRIFACGPRPVLRGVQRLSGRLGIRAQLSLDEMMACGVGACLGCVCKGAGERGYLRVCREGPVFAAEEVQFDG